MEPTPGPEDAFPGTANVAYQDGPRPGRLLGIASLGCGLGAVGAVVLLFLSARLFPAGPTVSNARGHMISHPGLVSRIGEAVEVVLVLDVLILPVVAVVLGFIARMQFRRQARNRNDRDFGTTGMVVGLVELGLIGLYIAVIVLIVQMLSSGFSGG